jgi:predicted small metal-binding protein
MAGMRPESDEGQNSATSTSPVSGNRHNPGGFMTRKVADCREMPSESGCTLTIAGEEEEVVRAAAEHAVSVHGHQDGADLRASVRGMLKDEQVSQTAL